MKRETQKINCILFNSILGLSALLWLFTSQQTWNEVIFLLIVFAFFITFSSLSIIAYDSYTMQFYRKMVLATLLNLLALLFLMF
ncbi:MAG: hypothetical protein ACI35P_01390 [Bacillus sp. (in: firmicutes)]